MDSEKLGLEAVGRPTRCQFRGVGHERPNGHFHLFAGAGLMDWREVLRWAGELLGGVIVAGLPFIAVELLRALYG
jgi:hypothetical protein